MRQMDYQRLLPVFRQYRIFWSVCAFCLLLNLLFYLIGVRGQDAEVAELRNIYLELRTGGKEQSGGDNILEQFLRAKADLQVFRSMLPEEKASEDISLELNRLLTRGGLDAMPVTLKPEGIVDLLMIRYTAEIRVEGAYSRLKQLLADIQNAPRLFCIEDLVLSGQIAGGGPVEMTLHIATYFRGSSQAADQQ